MKTYFLIWTLNYLEISQAFDLPVIDMNISECSNINLLHHMYIHIGIPVFNICSSDDPQTAQVNQI